MDKDGKKIEGVTNSNGMYIINNIPKGKYILLFTYDTTKYILTDYKKANVIESQNSDVILKNMNIDNIQKDYGVTDIIEIDNQNIANIDIGLIEAKIFDMKLEKFVDKVILQNEQGTTVKSYDTTTLSKIEVDAKQVNKVNVIIEYKIVVSNIGEIEGFIKNIVDYIPIEYTFNSEMNKDWYQKGECLYNSSLANEKILPGQSKEIKLVLIKRITNDSFGLISNTAEILEQYNELGIKDINSIPGNRNQNENDIGKADVIISIRTGKIITYIVLIISTMIIIGVSIYFIIKKVLIIM